MAFDGSKYIQPTPPVIDHELVDGLTRARELIAKGWVKGAFKYSIQRGHLWWRKREDRYCAVGAVNEVGRSDSARNKMYRALYGSLPRAARNLSIPDGAIMAFNDGVALSSDDVLGVFDRAIAAAKAGK